MQRFDVFLGALNFILMAMLLGMVLLAQVNYYSVASSSKVIEQTVKYCLDSVLAARQCTPPGVPD